MAIHYFKLTFTRTPGSMGTGIDYRKQGTPPGPWITPQTTPNPTTKDYYVLELEAGAIYDVRVYAVGGRCTRRVRMLQITTATGQNCCLPGWTLAQDGKTCFKEDTVAPTIQQANICLALSQLAGQYSSSGTRLYEKGYDLHLNLSPLYNLLQTPYWKESPGGLSGPMNREGVWVDTDCNGTKDGLAQNSQLQFSYIIPSTAAKTVYVGIGGDNTFKGLLNGQVFVDVDKINAVDGQPSSNFNFWHLLPVDIQAGPNLFTFQAVGDGTANDCLGVVIYDNVPVQLQTATRNEDLTILFRSSDFRGARLDLATCPPPYALDISAGQGNYQCRQILNSPSSPC